MSLPPDLAYAEARTRDHLRTLSIFHYVAAGLTVVGLLFLFGHYWMMHAFMAMPSMQAQPNPPPQEFFAMFVWFYAIFGVVLVVGGVLNLLTARYLRQHRHRMFCMVVAALNCLQMPLGTVLGVFTLVTLSGEAAQRLFDANSARTPGA